MKYLFILSAAAALCGCAGRRYGEPAGGTGPFVNTVAIFQAHRTALNQAGDDYRCEEAVNKAGRTMARDERLSDSDLRNEAERYERLGGQKAYPTPGTACAELGFREALRAALKARGGKKK